MPNAEPLLLDTHALLWWQAGGDRLSKRARSAIDTATSVLVSPISAWEIGTLMAKGRVGLDRPLMHWIDTLFRSERIEALALTPLIAAQASSLEAFHGDPADRMIYASALFHQCPLATKDEKIHSYARAHGDVRVVW
jgi:PIN domain nuclease of toxin-antitoxin system